MVLILKHDVPDRKLMHWPQERLHRENTGGMS